MLSRTDILDIWLMLIRELYIDGWSNHNYPPAPKISIDKIADAFGCCRVPHDHRDVIAYSSVLARNYAIADAVENPEMISLHEIAHILIKSPPPILVSRGILAREEVHVETISMIVSEHYGYDVTQQLYYIQSWIKHIGQEHPNTSICSKVAWEIIEANESC
jgi:hypothetical protein